jgi:L-aminopeptidase/D-esterase-like protein
MNTTIGAVATDATLTKAQCRYLARIAHDGLARAINPVHTLWDGDALFALATGRAGVPGNLMALGIMAGEAVRRATLRAVLAATAVTGPGVPGLPTAVELG